MWLCRMPYGGSRMLAGAFRSIGWDTHVTPDEDARTLELGAKYTSGDECYPQRIVLGDYLKLIEDEKLDPKKTAFLLPTANGPCRFGQYAGLLRRVLDDHGLPGRAHPFHHFRRRLRRYRRKGGGTDQDGLAGGSRAGHPPEAAPDDPAVRDRTGEYGQGLPGEPRSDGRHHRPSGDRQQGADGRSQGRPRPGEEGLPCHPGEAGGPPPYRRGRGDLLPPEHVRQQRGHTAHRGPGRRVLAGRRGRVGVVHQRRGLPPVARGEAPPEQGLAEELPHGAGDAQRRERAHGAVRRRLREPSGPTRPRDLGVRASLPAPRGGSGRDGASRPAGPSTSTTRAPTASWISARSPA